MADKLTTYQIEDSVSGKTYTIEGPEGATDEELNSYMESYLGGGDASEPPSPYLEDTPQQPDAPVEAPLQPQGKVTMQNQGLPSVVPTTFEGAVANQSDVAAIEEDAQRLAYGEDDQRLIVDAIRSGKSDDEVRALGREIAKAKGLGILDITPQSISEVRDYLTKGGNKPIGFAGQEFSQQLLGEDEPQVDPDVGYLGSALEKGMSYNPMGWATRKLQDWTDADLQGGMNKEALRATYPDLDDETLEEMHDALIGEFRRRESSNAQYQTDVRNVDPITDFVGDIIGGASPVDLIPMGRGATLPRRLLEGAGANIAVDAGMQAGDISYGAQDEFSYGQSAMAGAAGAALQGAVEGVVRGAKFASSKIPSAPRISPVTYGEGQGPVTTVMADPKKTGRTKAAKQEFANYNQSILQAGADHINNVAGEWKNAPEFEVLQDFEGIDGIDKKSIAAIDPEGKVRVNMKEVLSQAKAAKVDPETVLTAMTYHEALGHHGLASTFGKRLDGVMRSFYDEGTSDFKKEVNTWMENNPRGKKSESDWIALATEEVLAEMSERGQIPVTLENRIKNVVKSVGRKMGLDLAYSTREIKTILGMAHAATIAGKKGDVAGNGYKYSISPLSEAVNKYHKEKVLEAEGKLDDTPVGETRSVQTLPDTQPNEWRFRHLTEDGKSISGTYSLQNGKLTDFSIRSDTGPKSIGPTVVRQIGRDLIKTHEASGIEGFRVSGARNYSQIVEAGNKFMKSFKDPTKPNLKAGKFELEDDYRVTNEELSDIVSARKMIDNILEDYEPQETLSFAEQKRAARLAGLTSDQIKKASKKGVNELAKRIFAANEIANKTNDELAALADELGSTYLNNPEKFIRLKDRYARKTMEHNALIATLFDMNSEAGRALSAIRAIDHTFKKYGALSSALADFDKQNILGGFADDADFMKYVRLVSGLQQQGNPAGTQYALRATVKPYWWQYILSYRHAAMLSGLATHAKNATDSALMIVRELEETGLAAAGFPIRKMMKAAGMKVEDGVSPQEVAARAYGLMSAALDSKTYIEAADAFIKGTQNKPISSKTEMSDAHIPGVSKVTDLLHATDVFFRAFHQNANLYALGVRAARKDGYTGVAAFTEGSSRAHNPTLEMVKEAKRLADQTLLVDAPSMFGEMIEGGKKIRPNMTSGEQAQAFLANFFFPFFRVSDRLIFWAIRRSPLGVGPWSLDRVSREDWAAGGARRDISIARAAFGTAIIMSYWNAAGEGETEGAAPPKYAKQAALEGAGYLPNSVVSDGQYTDASALNLSFNPFDPQNATAANVASIRKAYDKGLADEDETAKALGMALVAFGSTLANASFAENISTYLDPFIQKEAGSVESASANLVSNVATQFLPAAARQVNDMAVDTKVRDTTGDGSFADKVKGRVMNSIPGLSDNLPQKYDVYGDEKEKGRTLLGLDNYQKRDQDEVGKELGRLERTTDKVVVSRAPSKITVDGEDYKLSAEAKQEWQRIQGSYLRDFMKEEMADPAWKTYSDEEKIEIVKEARKDASNETKIDMLPLLGLEEEEEDEGSY